MALRSDPGPVNGRRRIWPSSPFLKGLLMLHVLLALAFVLWPAHWLAWVVSFFTMHVLVGVLVLQPRNPFFGPNVTHLPGACRQRNEVAITFDDGPDALVTPQVLDLLDRFGAKASFFVIGNKLQNHPDLARDIVRRGHSLENQAELVCADQRRSRRASRAPAPCRAADGSDDL